MSILNIDETKCKKCGICVQSCPIQIIDGGVDGKIPSVNPENENRCIYCGHCESICPDSALVHELSALAAAPLIQSVASINATELGVFFRNRRSVRKYLPEKIDKAILEQVMDVVRYAPTGTNRQLNQWIIVSDSAIIEQLAAGTVAWMKIMSRVSPEMAGRYNIPALVKAFEAGNDRICRKAPHLFICYTASNYTLGSKDAVIATSHLELLLPAYGIGACWAGYLMMALQNSQELRDVIGLNESSAVHAVLMAGYPKYNYYTVPPRNKVDVKWL